MLHPKWLRKTPITGLSEQEELDDLNSFTTYASRWQQNEKS